VAADYFARAGVTPRPSPDSLIFANDFITCSGASCDPLPFHALVKMCHLSRVALGDRGFYATEHLDWDADTGCGTPFLYFTKGVAISEIEIDRFTGHMTVLRSDVLMDIGRPINPGIDRGQLTGAFIQGMGWLTNEELRWTPEGELLTHSPTTYKIPNIQDVPAVFNVDWIENNDNQLNVRGSKAVGEPPLLMAISVWMAVKNALTFLNGGKIPKLHAPATGEEILMRITEIMGEDEGRPMAHNHSWAPS
jgi:xanthine dehydrogenase large subunit